MDDDRFNIELRKFLKEVGVTSQREIEKSVRAAGKTTGRLTPCMVLTIPELGLEHVVEGDIALE